MAARNLSNRNLWIIAALVAATVALLGWALGSGVDFFGNEVADVGVEAAPGTVTDTPGGN